MFIHRYKKKKKKKNFLSRSLVWKIYRRKKWVNFPFHAFYLLRCISPKVNNTTQGLVIYKQINFNKNIPTGCKEWTYISRMRRKKCIKNDSEHKKVHSLKFKKGGAKEMRWGGKGYFCNKCLPWRSQNEMKSSIFNIIFWESSLFKYLLGIIFLNEIKIYKTWEKFCIA